MTAIRRPVSPLAMRHPSAARAATASSLDGLCAEMYGHVEGTENMMVEVGEKGRQTATALMGYVRPSL